MLENLLGFLTTPLTVLSSGWYAIIPGIVATITDLLIGGWLVDKLIKSGFDAPKVRQTLLTYRCPD